MADLKMLRTLNGNARVLAHEIVKTWIEEIAALEAHNAEQEAVVDALLDAVTDMECALISSGRMAKC